MIICRRLLIEDRADRLNHIWAFFLLLVLALTSLVLALIPQGRAPGTISRFSNPEYVPKYTSKCWFPPQFTSSMTNFAESSCNSAFNHARVDTEDDPDENSLVSSLYYPFHRLTPRENMTSFKPFSKSDISDRQKQTGRNNPETGSLNIHSLFQKMALTLFILAICLKLTHAFLIMYLEFAGQGLNYKLDSVQAAFRQDERTRQKYIKELVQSVSDTVNPSSNSLSLFYLFTKLLLILVAIVGILMAINLQVSVDNFRDQNVVDGALTNTTSYSSVVLICDVKIIQLHQIQRYSLQCTFTSDEADDSTGSSYNNSTTDNNLVMITLYEFIIKIWLLVMSILSIYNIFCFVMWLIKLMPGYCRRKLMPGQRLPIHVYLLLYMVTENVGYMEALELRKNFSTGLLKETPEELQILSE